MGWTGRRRTAASHSIAAPVRSRNGTVKWFINSHPCKVNIKPDDSEAAIMVTKITRSFAPWALPRSDGVWHSVGRVAPPMNMTND